MSKITLLSEIAKSQPHAAFAALTHGLLSKWTYYSRVVPNISHLLKPLDNVIQNELIPALTGRPPSNELESKLFALPARLGGLGIRLPSQNADREHSASTTITSMLRVLSTLVARGWKSTTMLTSQFLMASSSRIQ